MGQMFDETEHYGGHAGNVVKNNDVIQPVVNNDGFSTNLHHNEKNCL